MDKLIVHVRKKWESPLAPFVEILSFLAIIVAIATIQAPEGSPVPSPGSTWGVIGVWAAVAGIVLAVIRKLFLVKSFTIPASFIFRDHEMFWIYRPPMDGPKVMRKLKNAGVQFAGAETYGYIDSEDIITIRENEQTVEIYDTDTLVIPDEAEWNELMKRFKMFQIIEDKTNQKDERYPDDEEFL